MTVKFLQRSIWQRIFGISATDKPRDENGWHYESGVLKISLDRIPELTQSSSAVRFEGKNLPARDPKSQTSRRYRIPGDAAQFYWS